jgi:hypothetical protein
MLVDVAFKGTDPLLKMIAEMNGGTGDRVHLQTGVYLIGHWNFETEVFDELNKYPEFSPDSAQFANDLHARHPDKYDAYTGLSPDVLKGLHKFVPAKDEWDELNYMDSLGVVDSVEQLLSLYDFDADPRKLVISMVSIKRENCSSEGGWRYHKWGTYYGTQKPQHEYLYHDKHIDEVFTFHVHEIL